MVSLRRTKDDGFTLRNAVSQPAYHDERIYLFPNRLFPAVIWPNDECFELRETGSIVGATKIGVG